jgi:hypothetical protein
MHEVIGGIIEEILFEIHNYAENILVGFADWEEKAWDYSQPTHDFSRLSRCE